MSTKQDPITPIASSGEEEYQKFSTFSNINTINETNELNTNNNRDSEQKQNLRILQRQRGVEQLITSEEKYCNSLKKIITLYFEPLSSHLSAQNQFILFGDIKTIYQKNAQFSIALEQKYKTFNPSTTVIADDINKYFNPDLRSLYQNYVNRHEEATKLLSSLQTDSKFVKICDEAQSKYKKTRNGDSQSKYKANDLALDMDINIDIEKAHHLKNLLLLPIHRISKYELIIKDIVNNTDESHADYPNLTLCLHDICSISQLINDKMKEFSEREVVRKIANAIKGSESLKLETPYRKFIKNGYLIKMGKTKPQRYLFFLFNDLLFYCKKIGNKSDNNVLENSQNINIENDTVQEKENEDSKSHSNEALEEVIRDKVINLSTATVSRVAHDYSDTSDLHEITSLFGDLNKGRSKSRKSRTKLFSDPEASMSDPEDLSMTLFGMNIDIHNEIDVFSNLQAHFKVHNLMPIDAAFSVSDFRIHPQRYENKAFEIRSSVKSFIVVAESDRSKKEWMMLLEHCTNQLFQLSLKNNALSLNLTNKKSNNVLSSCKQKRLAATLYLPTNFTEQCMKCVKQFGYSRRKNHCHHCGLLVCSKCLSEKLPSLQIKQIDTLKAPTSNKSKSNTTSKVCNDCYTKNKHFFPEFEEASALSTNAKSKIFLYKQKSKQKSKRKKKGKKSKFKKLFKNKGKKLTEDVEDDAFYEKGSLKDVANTQNQSTNNKDAENQNEDEASDGSDSYELSENEPSMLSIPENDDHIETLIGRGDYEPSVSSHLAPHWTPHATATTSGHHNREFSHNQGESGYADNDSDSDEIQDTNNQQLLSPKNSKLLDGDLTPPVSDSDVPVSPYYDDTPLMDGKGSSETFDYSPPSSPTAGKLKLRPTNSLNMGNVLDELEREQQERREEEDFGDDDEELIENKKPAPPSRQSSLLRAIPEYEDTDEDTSANDVDAATAYAHMRNLSTHIEDQEYRPLTPPITPPDTDDYIDHTSIIHGNLTINIQRNGSQYDQPGNNRVPTPPPISPRYKKMAPHKRRLSDKLDKFLTERTGAQQLVQKQILYTTPEQDIEALKEKIQIKRDERDKIKKRLKRKLSHDFRPSEKDIEDRGIKIVPEVILSDEEDFEEEIIVYDNVNDRNSFSLQKKKSVLALKKKMDLDSGDYAMALQNERQRNSEKIKEALVERPTPSDMIEKGYISAANINNDIPPMNNRDLIDRLRAELKLEIIDNNNYKIEKEKVIFRRKRRHKILSFYDNYLFNYIFDDDTYPVTEQYVDIDMDYQQILDFVQNDLPINSQEISLEKEWMRNLRKRKFRTYINKNKCKMKQMKRNMIKHELNEVNQQLMLVENTQKIDQMADEVNRLEMKRVVLIENTSKQIDALRGVIKNLNKLHTKKNGFISVS